MLSSLVLFTLAKHLTNAAQEIEKLENEAIAQKISDNSVTEPRIENECKESSEESSEESSKESKKSSKKSKKSCEVIPTAELAEIPPVIPQVVEAPKEITLEILREECKKVMDFKGREVLASILTTFNVAKTSELNPSVYSLVVRACKAALEAKNEF